MIRSIVLFQNLVYIAKEREENQRESPCARYYGHCSRSIGTKCFHNWLTSLITYSGKNKMIEIRTVLTGTRNAAINCADNKRGSMNYSTVAKCLYFKMAQQH